MPERTPPELSPELLAALEELLRRAVDAQGAAAPPPEHGTPGAPPPARRGPLAAALMFGAWIVGCLAAGSGGTLIYLSAGDPSPRAIPLSQRLAVDVHQTRQAMLDGPRLEAVADAVGDALAHGSIACSVEWRTDAGKLIATDQIRGHTSLDGSGVRYRQRRAGEPTRRASDAPPR